MKDVLAFYTTDDSSFPSRFKFSKCPATSLQNQLVKEREVAAEETAKTINSIKRFNPDYSLNLRKTREERWRRIKVLGIPKRCLARDEQGLPIFIGWR